MLLMSSSRVRVDATPPQGMGAYRYRGMPIAAVPDALHMDPARLRAWLLRSVPQWSCAFQRPYTGATGDAHGGRGKRDRQVSHRFEWDVIASDAHQASLATLEDYWPFILGLMRSQTLGV